MSCQDKEASDILRKEGNPLDQGSSDIVLGRFVPCNRRDGYCWVYQIGEDVAIAAKYREDRRKRKKRNYRKRNRHYGT